MGLPILTYKNILYFRPLFKEIKASGENHIVLDCKADKILDILRQARSVEMMGDYHSFIITSLVSTKPFTVLILYLYINYECSAWIHSFI